MPLTILMGAWLVNPLGNNLTGHIVDELRAIDHTVVIDKKTIVACVSYCGAIIAYASVDHRKNERSNVRIFVDAFHRDQGIEMALRSWARDECKRARRLPSF